MTKRVLLCCVFLFQGIISNAQFDISKITSQKAAVNDPISANLKLVLDNEELQKANELLGLQYEKLSQDKQLLAQRLLFIYFRDQINQQTIDFTKDGSVLPAFQYEVRVVKDDTGKINQIILRNNLLDEDNYIKNLFTPTKEMETSAPALYQALIKKEVIYVHEHYDVVQMQIKRSKFPYLIMVKGNDAQKKKYAELLLAFIKNVDSEQSKYNGLYNSYVSLERKMVPKGELDKLIAHRVEFLSKFKAMYETASTK